MTRLSLSVVCWLAALLPCALGADWPQYLGPDRDGTWSEESILTAFPEQGPEVLWRVDVGYGYSGPAVADGRVFLSDYVVTKGELSNNPSSRTPLEGQERVRAFDVKTGEELWAYSYTQPYNLSYPGGPRSTPTYADGKLYMLGAEGRFTCLKAETGEVLWEQNWMEAYDIKESPIWGFSMHPLIAGDTLYALVGGEGSVAVAFDKDTGAEKWRALSSVGIGYCPPTLIEAGGAQQLLIWHPQALNALNPKTGETYWTVPLKPNYGMSISPPSKVGNFVFASGIGKVGALIELSESEPAAEIKWRAKPKEAVFTANVKPIIKDGIIYGCDVDTGAMMAARLEDGQRLWASTVPTLNVEKPERRARHGTAFMTLHKPSGLFYLYAETGHLIIADLTAEGYREISRVRLQEQTNEAFGRPVVWAAPAFAEQSAFLRNDKELIRVNLAE